MEGTKKGDPIHIPTSLNPVSTITVTDDGKSWLWMTCLALSLPG